MRPLSAAGLMASLAPAAIVAWRDPARDPESLIASLLTLAAAWVFTFIAIVRFPAAIPQRPAALLVQIVWGIVAALVLTGEIGIPHTLRTALLLLPAPIHIIRLLGHPRALSALLAVQVLTLFSVDWVYSDPVESTPSASEIARAQRTIAGLPPSAPFSLYLEKIAAENHSQLRDAMVTLTVARFPDIDDQLIAALNTQQSITAALEFLESDRAPCNARLAEATIAVGVNLRACPVHP